MYFESKIIENYFQVIFANAFHSLWLWCLFHSELRKYLDMYIIEMLITSAALL